MLTALTLTALKVLILAGGGSAEENHHSHLVHVQALDHLLQDRGVDPRDIVLFWADGTAPGPDRGIIDEAPLAGESLIEGTALDAATAIGSRVENTIFPGREVRPAKRAELQKWLGKIGPSLTDGDTLLVAVTDHGEPDPDGGRETAITLWDDRWTVSQMEQDLRSVPEGTRIVLIMSQCHSGGFADLAKRRPNLCGSFSTHSDRLSYGCYPHLAVQEDIGHFMHVTRGLAREGAIGPATDLAMLTDDSPDVPHLSSDAFLFDALTEEMGQNGGDVQGYVDGHLERVPEHPDWQRISRLSARYGIGMLDGYGATLQQWDMANLALDTLTTWSDRWARLYTQTRNRLAQPLADELVTQRPEKTPRRRRATDRRRRLKARANAIENYRKALSASPRQARQIRALGDHLSRSSALMIQLEQQEAALVRAMYLFGRRAGPGGLSAKAKAQYSAMRTCEQTRLIPSGAPPPPSLRTHGQSMAPIATNMSAVVTVQPGFLGIGYRQDGATKNIIVDQLVAGGPAAAANLRVGDEILSVDGWAIEHPVDFRAAASLAVPGKTIPIKVRRSTGAVVLSIQTAAAPLPPRPPAIGEMVPPLQLTAMDADRDLPVPGLGRPMALLFWTTDCPRCEKTFEPLAQWATRYGVQILVVTGESRETVSRYLAGRKSSFPFRIGLDRHGESARLFGVDETPTVVILGPTGQLMEVRTGSNSKISQEPPSLQGSR